jgi:hypothetical protein
LFFCLPETSIISGQVVAVDGGLSTGGAQPPPEDSKADGRPEA